MSVFLIVFQDNPLEMVDSTPYTNEETADAVCKNFADGYYAGEKSRKPMVKKLGVCEWTNP